MDSPNSMEFTMKKKEDGKLIIKRAGIFIACIMPLFIILGIVAVVQQGLFLAFALPLLILTIYACWFTKRFTRIEYEYTILSGDFSIAAIYDNLSRKDLMSTKIKDMHKIVPYHTNEPLLNAPEINQVLYYCSDLENPDLYIGIFDDEKKGRLAVVFNTSRKFVQIMKFYNGLNVILKNDFLM
jgi:hypothetical protein